MVKIVFNSTGEYIGNSSWIEGGKIKSSIDSGEIYIQANKEGLISLATLFLKMAEENDINKNHIHLDEFNSLEEGSTEIIIEKNNDI